MSDEAPPFLFFKGEVVPWERGTVHVWSETAIRGTNVFEGVRAYWNSRTGGWNLICWDDHITRLLQSAHLMRIPHEFDAEYFLAGAIALLQKLPYRDHMYLRPTIFIERGAYGYKPGQTIVGDYLVAFPVSRYSEDLHCINCCISSWRRPDDNTGISRAKAGASYLNIRLPRIESKERSFDDAIMLNHHGDVAEATGAAIFCIRKGKISTPRITDGIIESITRATIIDLLHQDFGFTVEERAIDRSELYVADEVFTAGTLAEITAVVRVDDLVVGDGQPGPITRKLAKRYSDIVLGKVEDTYKIVNHVAAE